MSSAEIGTLPSGGSLDSKRGADRGVHASSPIPETVATVGKMRAGAGSKSSVLTIFGPGNRGPKTSVSITIGRADSAGLENQDRLGRRSIWGWSGSDARENRQVIGSKPENCRRTRRRMRSRQTEFVVDQRLRRRGAAHF